MKSFILLALSLVVVGCATTLPPPDTNTKKAAMEAFLYAQLAANAYEPHDEFKLPPDVVRGSTHHTDDSTGFAYSVYRLVKPDRLVMSFRGTDGLRDWILGNFLGLQNDRGLQAYEKLRKATPQDVPIILVGHSLGGAIAQHIALRVEGVRVFGFNPSTRFSRGPHPKANPIWLISEYAEAARVLDRLTIDPKSTQTIVSCTYGGPIKNHAREALAACLTRIAADEGDSVAQWSIANNLKIRCVSASSPTR